MSDLSPRGTELVLGGKTYHLLFTVRVIDEIQAACNLPLPDAVARVARIMDADYDSLTTFLTILTVLLDNDGAGLSEAEVGRLVTRKMCGDVALAMLTAYEESMPESDDDDDDEDDADDNRNTNADDRAVNIARLLYIGQSKLGYSEAEVFSMTLRKFFLIYNEYLELNGVRKDKEDESLLDTF